MLVSQGIYVYKMCICNWVIHRLFPGQQKNSAMTEFLKLLKGKLPCQGEVSFHRRTTPKLRVIPNEKTVFSTGIVLLHQIVTEAEAVDQSS